MAYPTINAQQEINNRKILKDLQINKQLLEKGVVPGITTNVPNLSMPSFIPSNAQQQTDLTLNPSSLRSTQAWTQATNQSFGFFVPQDSLFGNNILPVLPRFDNQSKMKLKKLEEFLQGVDGFDKPKLLLEQYVTPSHIASNMLFTIQSKFGDLEDKIVADLGCGSGMLSIGAFLLGSQFTIGFDIDRDALNVLQRNVSEMEIPGVDCVQCNVIQDLANSKWTGIFQTVIMNPPFGTKHNAGMDIKFLETGIALAEETVYSLHKTSTRDFIKKKSQEWGIPAEVIAELKYNIDATYKFHKKSSVDIEVDCWRFNVLSKKVKILS